MMLLASRGRGKRGGWRLGRYFIHAHQLDANSGSAGVRGPQQMFFICWGARLARNEREARK
jgi:hypothetical protein